MSFIIMEFCKIRKANFSLQLKYAEAESELKNNIRRAILSTHFVVTRRRLYKSQDSDKYHFISRLEHSNRRASPREGGPKMCKVAGRLAADRTRRSGCRGCGKLENHCVTLECKIN